VDTSTINGLNAKYCKLYDRFAPLYDIAARLYARWKNFNEAARRMEYLRELDIKGGDSVLEVSVGTGANLYQLPRTARYFGLDLSWGMLTKCRKNLKKWGFQVELFQGEAEHLPFKDKSFDVVFHVGDINFFNDRAQAIHEMIRVAKPGTKIMIADENERIAEMGEKLPISKAFYKDRPETITAPVDLIPRNMLDIEAKNILDGDLYCVTFRKPQ
jgi:ubiquinone/menaquinone biosynthesis C-methylase UbiE